MRLFTIIINVVIGIWLVIMIILLVYFTTRGIL